MPVTAVLGEQRGDEGKGRFVDMLAAEHDVVARFNGGNNAGHTVVLPDGRVLELHMIPSGIAHEDTLNVIGNGALVNPGKLVEEMESVETQDIEICRENFLISSAAHLIMPHHIEADVIREKGSEAQGSTKSGIAQVAASKTLRIGARVEMINNDPGLLALLAFEALLLQREAREAAGLDPINERDVAHEFIRDAQRIGRFATDTSRILNHYLSKDGRILAEGAQAFLLDLDHGMYPYTTSTATTAGGVAVGLGIPPGPIERVIGVVKATQSHVGGGPFVTEIHDPELLADLHGDLGAIDAETGTTTGRTRRLGHLDLPGIRRAQMVNGTHEMALTKLDWIPRYGQEVPVCVAYERKGKVLKDDAPDAAYKLEQCRPIYEWLPTWCDKPDIQDVRNFSDLPREAQDYVEFIEDQTSVPITMIGVGPRRDQVILCPR